jgi:hypothetical protein
MPPGDQSACSAREMPSPSSFGEPARSRLLLRRRRQRRERRDCGGARRGDRGGEQDGDQAERMAAQDATPGPRARAPTLDWPAHGQAAAGPDRAEERPVADAGARDAVDEELERETKLKAAALAILGARAAERYDAAARREYFRAPWPPHARRSACSCGAWPTRRSRSPSAARRPEGRGRALGQQAPSGRQLFLLRLMGCWPRPRARPGC